MKNKKESESENADEKAENPSDRAPEEPVSSGETEVEQASRDAEGARIEEAVEGKGWQIAQLATTLLSQSPSLNGPSSVASLWQDEYLVNQVRESVRKARIILDIASDTGDEETRLSTWFEPDAPVSITEIKNRLSEIGWKTVGRKTTPNYNTIKAQIEAVERRWTSKLQRLETQSSEIYDKHHHAADLVAGAIKELCADPMISSELPHLETESTEFLKKIHQGVLRSSSELKRIDFERHQALYDWCFMQDSATNDDQTDQTDADSEEKIDDKPAKEKESEKNSGEDCKKRGKTEARFRVYELLRFAETQWELELSESEFRNRLGDLTDEEAQEQAASANDWLPVHFRPRMLSHLNPSFALPRYNCPLPTRGSFEGFNSDGVKSSLEQYPWRS